MARPLRIEFAGGLYHVVSHGNGRLWLFKDDLSHREFLNILGRYSTKYKVVIHAFLLMKTHFHLLVETLLPNLSQFMSHFLRDFAVYYNRGAGRRGSVFRSRYGAFIVQKNRYYRQATKYIYYNPVKAGVVKHPRDYRWSSLYYFLHKNLQKEIKWYNSGIPLSLLGGIGSLLELLEGEEYKMPLLYKQFIGDRQWADNLIKKRKLNEEISGGSLMRRGSISPDDILHKLAKQYRVTEELILKGDERDATAVAMHLITRHTPLLSEEVGKMFGLKKYALAQRLHRFRKDKLKEKQMKRLITSLENDLLRGDV